MSKDYSEWELQPSDKSQGQTELFPPQPQAPQTPQVEQQRGRGRGVLWAVVALLLIVIVAAAAVLYLVVSGRGEQWFGAGAKDEAAPKRTVTATATETVKVKSSEKTNPDKTKKDRCAASAFINDPSRFVVHFCDGQWAVTGVEGTGGVATWRWGGSGWAEYERHGTQWPSDYACFDMGRLKREGAPAGFRNAVTACEESETTKTTTKKKETTSTATPTAVSIEERCAPKMFAPSGDTPESGIGSVVVKYCDGQWAYWGVYGVGGLVVSKWNGSEWNEYQRFTESMSDAEACVQMGKARSDGMPEELVSQLWTCDG